MEFASRITIYGLLFAHRALSSLSTTDQVAQVVGEWDVLPLFVARPVMDVFFTQLVILVTLGRFERRLSGVGPAPREGEISLEIVCASERHLRLALCPGRNATFDGEVELRI